MNHGERLAVVEIELGTIKKLLYLVIGGVGAQAISPLLPLMWLTLLG